MTYPNVKQLDEMTLRTQLALEVEATRGRSMWREPKPASQPRFRLRLRAARA